jgi:hypothetical protein
VSIQNSEQLRACQLTSIRTIFSERSKDFADTYGTGLFCEFVTIWNFRDATFFQKPLPEFLWGPGGTIEWYENVRATGGHQWPYTMFPNPGGILPFAMVIDVYHLNWLTKGSPERWDIVFWNSDEQEFLHLQGDSFGKCLLKMLRGQYKDVDALQLDHPCRFTQ